MRWRLAHETRGSDVTSISPSAPGGASSGSGLRTATAHVETPRIITPSSTAWPPSGASRPATGMPSGMRGWSAGMGAPLSPSMARSMRGSTWRAWRRGA